MIIMIEKLNNVPKKEEMLSWIMAMCDKGYRRPGTSASHKVEKFLENRLKSFGFQDIRRQEIKFNLWEPEYWRFTYKLNGKVHESPCFYACYTPFTEQEGISGDLVYIGKGEEQDFKKVDLTGKIVVIDLEFLLLEYQALSLISPYIHNPKDEVLEDHNIPDMSRGINWVAYHRAAKQGAIGFIGILSNYPLDSPIFYYPAEGIDDFPRPIPGIFLSKSEGYKLKKRLKNASEPIQGRIVLTGEEKLGTTSNIFGILPGNSKELIELGSHHDAAFHGAVQDASGVSVILALAKYFSQIPKKNRKRGLLVLFSTGHFYGSIGGYEFIKEYKELVSRIVTSIHIEHIGLEPTIKDEHLITTGLPQIRGLFVSDIPEFKEAAKQMLIDHNLELTGIMPIATNLASEEGSDSKYSQELSLWTDATPFFEEGIPVFSFISGPFYNWHPKDMIDKVAVDQLEPVTKGFIDIINKIEKLTKENLLK